MAKKFYWLRLKDDWFDSKVIKKLRKIAGGDTYTIIYLKMQLLSLKNEGKLYFDSVEDTFAEELALELNEDVDNVSVTLSFLQKNGLLEIEEGDTFALTEVPAIIGSEAASTARSRECRERKKQLVEQQKMLQCNTVETQCNTEKEKELEKDIENKRENTISSDLSTEQPTIPEPEPIIKLPLNTGEEYPIYQTDIDEFSKLYPAVDVLQALRNMRGWCMTNPSKRKTKRGVGRFINSWLAREQDRGGTPGYNRGTNSTGGSNVERFAEKARRWADE